MGSFVEPNRELSFGGPRKFVLGGDSGMNPLEAIEAERQLKIQQMVQETGLAPETVAELVRIGPQGIEVDTDAWMSIVGALAGGYQGANGSSGLFGFAKEAGEEVLDRGIDYISESLGLPSLSTVRGLRSGRGVRGELPAGRPGTGSRVGRNMQDGINVQPSSGEAFMGHNPVQTRTAAGQFGPNTAGGVTTSGQRLPSVRPSTEVATRNVGVMAPNSAQSNALIPRGNTLPATYSPGMSPSGPAGGIGMMPVLPLVGQAIDAYFDGDEASAEPTAAPAPGASGAPSKTPTPGFDSETTSGYPGVGRPTNQSTPQRSSGSPEFNQAFREARQRGDLEFTFGDKQYGTRRAGETDEQWNNAMDQVKIKSQAAKMRNTPQEMGIEAPKEISFDRPQATLQTSSAKAPAAKPAASTGKAAIKANRQENKSIRQGMRQERKDTRQAKSAEKKISKANAMGSKAAKVQGRIAAKSPNSEQNTSTTSFAKSQNKTGGLKDRRKMSTGGNLKTPGADQKGLKKLPTSVRNKMGYKKNGGYMKTGGKK